MMPMRGSGSLPVIKLQQPSLISYHGMLLSLSIHELYAGKKKRIESREQRAGAKGQKNPSQV